MITDTLLKQGATQGGKKGCCLRDFQQKKRKTEKKFQLVDWPAINSQASSSGRKPGGKREKEK